MAWYDNALFYHIYPLGLLGAEKQNPYGEVNHRLRELSPWIDHIEKIGCNAIYIGPLFESVGHGYETTDYRKVDSRLGDNDDLKKFVKDCHERNIRVILDGVFNHTGRDFFAFKDIKQIRENSRYKDWYSGVNFRGNNEYNDGFSYDNWGGYNLLVKLNLKNPEVRDYLLDTVKFWVDEFDIDGLRLDAADVLDFDFMRSLRGVADTVKPEFWLMGEVIHGDYSRWVNEGTLHSVTNYQLHKAFFSAHNDHNYFEIAHTVKRLYQMGGERFKLYNFVDNHDVERIFSKLNNKADFLPVHILLYTLPGIPSLYYGSEFGIEGKKERGSDDSLRPKLNLVDFEGNDKAKFITALGNAKKSLPQLSWGEYSEKTLTTTFYSFVRTIGNSSVLVAVNNADGENEARICGLIGGEYVGVLGGETLTVSGGEATVKLSAHSGEIFAPKDTDFKRIELDIKKFNEENKKQAEKAKAEKEKFDASLPDVGERTDYENMNLDELHAAILAKMAKNGPVTDYMKKTVFDNNHIPSLIGWAKSFR